MSYVIEIILFILAFLGGRIEERRKNNKRLIHLVFYVALVFFVILQINNCTGDRKKSQVIEGLKLNVENLHGEIKSLTVTIEQQSKTLAQLKSLLLAALPEDVLKKAENLYNEAIENMREGNKIKSAEAFKELSSLALGVDSYNTAAIASLIASFRYEEANIPLEAAELKSQAGDIYLKLNDIDEAKLWKREALKIYRNQGLEIKAQKLNQEIQLLDQKK